MDATTPHPGDGRAEEVGDGHYGCRDVVAVPVLIAFVAVCWAILALFT